jgi:hypothetical protein
MRLYPSIKNIFWCGLVGTIFFQSENLLAQDSSAAKWRLRYSASFNYFPFTIDNHVEISPASLQVEFFINKFGIYGGPRLFDKVNDESPYHPEPQSFIQRIGFAFGMEYFIFEINKKSNFFLLYNFQYHHKIGHGLYPPDPNYPNDFEKSDDYYFENTGGAGVCLHLSDKMNIALHYSIGNLRIKRNLSGNKETKDYFDHLVALSIGYDLK